MVVFFLELFFKEGVPDGINSFKIILDTLETVFDMLLSLENVAKDFMIENGRVLFNFVQGRCDVVVGEMPRIFNQLLIIIVVDPSCFKSKRTLPSG